MLAVINDIKALESHFRYRKQWSWSNGRLGPSTYH